MAGLLVVGSTPTDGGTIGKEKPKERKDSMFTRDFLRKTAKDSGIELPKEMEDALIQEHISTRDKYAATEVTKALEENKPPEPVKVKDTEEYKTLKKEFETYKQEQEQKEIRGAKETAYRSLLKKIGVEEKRIDAIMKISDVDSLEIVDGALKDAEKIEESAKKEWESFIPVKQTQGADVPTPPTSQNQNGKTGRAAELERAYHERKYGKGE